MFLPKEWVPSFSIEKAHSLSAQVPVSFLETIRVWLMALVPNDLQGDEERLMQWLRGQLPIIDSFPLESQKEVSGAIPITSLFPAQFGLSLERYVVDAITRRLIPGAYPSVVGQVSLQFSFTQNPREQFFFHQLWIGVRDAKEKQEILENVKPLFNEIRMNMSAICQGRSLQISRGVHPTFMPRNEEELLRNLVLLSKEIQFVRDLPQVSIHYEGQSDHHLIFIVLLARLRIGAVPCVHQLFADQTLRCEVDEVRMLGQLRGKYPKEAAILHLFVEKGPFFRSDFSIDLLRARQRVAAELTLTLGEFRDFNGGMILKQEEALCDLRKHLSSLSQSHEVLLENYFYSLRPVIAQTVYDPLILKAHFELLSQNAGVEIGNEPYKLFRTIEQDYELFFLFANQLDTRKIVRELKKEPYRAVTTLLTLDRVTALGWIVKKDAEFDVKERIDRFFVS